MGFTVLIVDDHPGFRSQCRALLEAEGVVVLAEAEDGRSGVAGVRAMRPDIALVDVYLPDIDGFEVAARLRDDGVATVVLTSTRDMSRYSSRIAACGAAGFVPKDELSASSLVGFLAG